MREFNRGAAHNELGMQPVEITGDDVDGDGDGVVNEMTVADMTALAVYLAAQPRPLSLIELDVLRQALNQMGAAGQAEAVRLGLPTLTNAQKNAIANGAAKFVQAQCATCHKPRFWSRTRPSRSRARTRATATRCSRPARTRSSAVSIPRTRSRSTSGPTRRTTWSR